MTLNSPQLAQKTSHEFYVRRNSKGMPPLGIFFNDVVIEGLEDSRFSIRWKGPTKKNLGFIAVCGLYEASYAEHFNEYPQLLSEVSDYEDVYDIAPIDTLVGVDYANAQTARYTHIQDIAIRRLVQHQIGGFSGSKNEKLQIRTNSRQQLGVSLSPFYVPFISPNCITINPLVEGRWRSGSVEDFYQSNRRLVVATSGLIVPDVISDRINAQLGKAVRIEPA